MSEVKISDFLERMGLTEYESKTLATLFKSMESDAPAISRAAQVPKTRVYDVLERLVRRGLVIEIKTRPKKYRVVDSAKAIDKLIDDKKNEILRIEERAVELKGIIAGIGKMSEEGEKVMRVKDKTDFERILSQELSKTKNSIYCLGEIGSEHQIVIDAIEKAKSKNVSVKLVNSLTAYPNTKHPKWKGNAKHFKHGLNAFVLDNKKVIMALSDFRKEASQYHFIIWDNNKHMANALNHYFQKCWQQGRAL